MLYNLAQCPISNKLRQHLLDQVDNFPPITEKINDRLEAIETNYSFFVRYGKHVELRYESSQCPKFAVRWTFHIVPIADLWSTADRLKFKMALDEVERAFQDQLVVEVKPPDKIVMLHEYGSERYSMPASWFYCLPEEIEGLKKDALEKALHPFENAKIIDFTKPPEKGLSTTVLPIGRSFDEIFGDSGDAHPDSSSLIPPSAR